MTNDNNIYGSFGDFDPTGLESMTDEDWAEYDAHMGGEILKWDEENADDYIDLDPEPPF